MSSGRSAYGASRPMPRVQTKVRLLSDTCHLRGSNGSSCPEGAITQNAHDVSAGGNVPFAQPAARGESRWRAVMVK